MIVLDTKVLSELMRPRPNEGVFAWVAAQSRSSLYDTSVTQAELLYGVAAMPRGRRRDSLGEMIDALFAEEFAGRVLPFGGAAATSLVAGAAVATRDIRGFSGCGLTLIPCAGQ